MDIPEIKSFLYSFENNQGDMEHWEIRIAKITEGLYKGMAIEKKFNLSIPWTIINLDREGTLKTMIKFIKEIEP